MTRDEAARLAALEGIPLDAIEITEPDVLPPPAAAPAATIVITAPAVAEPPGAYGSLFVPAAVRTVDGRITRRPERWDPEAPQPAAARPRGRRAL